MRDEVTGAILAGGMSRRLGRDKALLRVGGRTLLEVVAQVAVDVLGVAQVIGRPEPSRWPIESVTFRLDDQPKQGPMGGLATALREAKRSVLLLGCDMPALQPDTIRWLLQVDRQLSARDGTIPHRCERPEPLFAIYRLSSLPIVERCLGEGRLSLLDVIAAGAFARPSVPAELEGHLVNINEPGDLERFIGG